MRVGYPTINLRLRPDPDAFDMVSRAPEQILAIVERNLDHLERVLRFNREHGILFFRLRPDLVPYAQQPRFRVDWRGRCGERLAALGAWVRDQGMRLTVHPDLATALNAESTRMLDQSVADLEHQAALLEAMGLDRTHKIQLHVGPPGRTVEEGIDRFLRALDRLSPAARGRLAVENENVFCTLERCLRIHLSTGLPVVFDTLHHELDFHGEGIPEALAEAGATWGPADGLPMVDYSSQRPGKMPGRHAEQLDEEHFRRFVERSAGFDFDLMTELKDREVSALRVLELLRGDPRLVTTPPG